MILDSRMCEALPAWEIAGKVNDALGGNNAVVVTAPPGAGKSTLLPLTILQGLEDGGRIIMLEPRRIAARQVAARMASMIGETVGETVGYRVRMESKVSRMTRIEVLTEGVLTRMLVEDPTLEGVSVVIFDEFHERKLQSDIALAILLETQSVIRPELKLLIMSATIESGAICSFLGAPLVSCEGRCFPVESVYCEEPSDMAGVPSLVAKYVRQALNENEGDVLAFLPGEAEIRKCQELLSSLENDSLRVMPLYGMLPFEAQKAAVMPSAPGKRKVVLATPVAETSLTIDGVRAVVDSGFCRKLVFDVRSGMSRMETVRISKDMATQRAGRAGRTACGKCYKLWCSATEARMAETRVAEILECDLSPLVLDVASWGCADIHAMKWLTPPPSFAVNAAMGLLAELGALDEGRITAHGKRLASFPCHPRLAQMLLHADTPRLKALASDMAAILEERDPMGADSSVGADLALRVSRLRQGGKMPLRGVWERIFCASQRYCSICGVGRDNGPVDSYEVGALLCAAYPERIAKAVKGRVACWQLSSGDMVRLDMNDPLASAEWIVCADLNLRKGADGTAFVAAAVDVSDLGEYARERLNVGWDSRKGAVVARKELKIGVLELSSRPFDDIDDARCADILCGAAVKEGESMFDFNDGVQQLQRRVAMLALWHPELELPDVSNPSLLQRSAEWLPAIAGGARNVQALKKLDMREAIRLILGYDSCRKLDALVPEYLQLPGGRRYRLEYRPGAVAPVLAIKLQECFGVMETPRVDGGARPILVELLSPGYKPVQLTSDLRSFWSGTYFEVRKELKRRYPKHSWPEVL